MMPPELDLGGVDLPTELLRTARLVLRPWTDDDVDEVTRAYQDPQMARWMPGPAPFTRDDAAAFVRRTAENRAAGQSLFAAVEAGGRLVGSVGLHFGSSLLGPGLGYWTAPSARGHGYAAEAAAAVARWAFAHGAHRVHLLADVDNLPSQVVARRAGFVEEGRMRSALPYRDGRFGDALLFSRLPGDPSPG
jgi:RimJ/RimL family protein N-acetyltransferase